MGAALRRSPRGRGGQFIWNLSWRDPRRPGAASTNERAVAGGGRAAAPGITASVRGHPGRGGPGPVAEDYPGPLVPGRVIRGERVGAQPAGGRRSRGSGTTSGGGRPLTPAALGSGVPRRRGGGVDCGIGRDPGPGARRGRGPGPGGGPEPFPWDSERGSTGTPGTRVRHVRGAPADGARYPDRVRLDADCLAGRAPHASAVLEERRAPTPEGGSL